MFKAIKRVELKDIPFDKADSTGFGLVHATGYDVKLENGEWVTEYEDFIYEDSPNCQYESEWDYE